MSPSIRKRPAAQRDLLEHFVALGERAGEATALRFLQAAEATCAELAAMPGMGRTEDCDNPRLTGMRRWRVRGFDNYLIFDQPLAQGIDVLRVVYGTRDLPGLFLAEEHENHC
jgi:toxin ParE1/3/4